MAKSTPDVMTFSGGERDRLALARVDREDAHTAAEIMENVTLSSSGAMSLFPGTIHVGATVDGARAWLRSWSSSVDLSYTLELTPGRVRFITADGLEEIEGAAATVGEFADDSGVPSTGDPAPGEGGELTVTVGEISAWSDIKGSYVATGTFSISGGNGDYLSPPTAEVLSGQADTISPAVIDGAGFVILSDNDGAAVSFRVKVYDSAGNFGYSGTFTVPIFS